MRRHLVLVVALAATGSTCAAMAETSWIFRASYYSHDPATGKRVNQFAPEKTAYVRTDPTYQESVYRHSRSGFEVGGSFDYMHTVETWGQGERIRPYGEWLYPYRAGATPFGPWGNPQGPWTTPFGSWSNPYGLGRLLGPPWGGMPAMPLPGVDPMAAPQQVAPPSAPTAPAGAGTPPTPD
jgi:hypothetical protein